MPLRLKQLRLEREITQQEIADMVKISRSVISQYENGLVEPTASVISKLADFFEVSTDYLLNRSDDYGNVSVQNGSTTITNDEKKLLNNFRSMRRDLQEALLNLSDSWGNTDSASANPGTKQKKN